LEVLKAFNSKLLINYLTIEFECVFQQKEDCSLSNLVDSGAEEVLVVGQRLDDLEPARGAVLFFQDLKLSKFSYLFSIQ
jgi:hypothetical protein